MITREKLEARLAELKQNLEQIKQQFTVTTGAIADVEYWLREWDINPEAEKESSR